MANYIRICWLAIIVRNCCPSLVGQLNEFSVLIDDETFAVLEAIYDRAWLEADDVPFERLDALALWNLCVQSAEPPCSGIARSPASARS